MRQAAGRPGNGNQAGTTKRCRQVSHGAPAPQTDPETSAEPSDSQAPEQSRIHGLVIVATPIGNAGDISLRALAVLKSADAILCEDTRVSMKLLTRHGIRRPLLAYHEHNAERMRPKILGRLRRGESLALISDAGTPLVSDPGYKLVQAVISRRPAADGAARPFGGAGGPGAIRPAARSFLLRRISAGARAAQRRAAAGGTGGHLREP